MNVIKCLKCLKWRVPGYDDFITRHIATPAGLRNPFSIAKEKDSVREKVAKEEAVDFVPFYDMMIRRRDEALRSILIKLHDQSAIQAVLPYLKSLKNVKSTIFYTLDSVKNKFVLVEFSSIDDVNHILSDTYTAASSVLPAEGRVFLFQDPGKPVSTAHVSVELKRLQHDQIFQLSDTEKFSKLDDIMDAYLTNAEVCDLSTRLHFLTCVQVERIFLGAFPKVRAIPFGSSVNGFGRKGSDLDISLLFNHKQAFSRNRISNQRGSLVVRPLAAEKSLGEVVQVFGDMLRVMLPSCSNVITVPNARIPIVKFRDCDTGLDCDLNVSGPLGICMSEMLYSLSSWDQRCRALLFTVRAWARHHGITSFLSPTAKLTNFSLLLLVIYFLQTKNVLPTLVDMEQLADDRDVIVYQGQPHLYLRHITPKKLKEWRKTKNNREEASQLLLNFFTFYSKFQFETKAISITRGQLLNNPTRDAMYIVNPLEETLNVARNVRLHSVQLFQYKCKMASDLLLRTQWETPLNTWYSLFEMESVITSGNQRPGRKSNVIQELFMCPEKRSSGKLPD